MPDSTQPRPRRRLARLVDSILGGMPQPGQQERQRDLQDGVLPQLQEDARVSWFLVPHFASSSQLHYLDQLSCVPEFLSHRMEATHGESEKIQQLNRMLEEMRVFDLLDAAAESPDLPVLNKREPAHEVRILSQVGHPRAAEDFGRLLRRVVAEPKMLSGARDTLVTLPSTIEHTSRQVNDEDEYTVRRMGNVFSGLVLLTANCAVTPMIMCSQGMSLALLSSFVGGIAMVEQGIIGRIP